MTNGGEWGSFMAVSIVLTGLREDAVRKPRRNSKRRWVLAEAAFLLKAQSMGFRVARPWGDSDRYDFILDSGGRLWRVQLKSTEVLHSRGYEVQSICGVYGRGKSEYWLMTSMFWWCESRRLTLAMCGRSRLWRRSCGSIRTLNANARGGRVIGRLGG
jgi:hypothetical protein